MFLKKYLSIVKRNTIIYLNNKKSLFYFLNHNSIIRKPRNTFNIKNKFVKLGNDVVVDYGASINIFHTDKSLYPLLDIEDNVHISDNITILCAKNIHIGKNTMIGQNVFIIDENHGISRKLLYYSQDLDAAPIFIGENVWICANAIILPGVTIGDNAIIGAGSVVTKNIEKDSIAVGNPARIVKKYDYNISSWIKINNVND